MTTPAAIRPRMSVALPRPAVWVLLVGTILSLILGVLGGAWDLAYHRTYVVDTFLSPPHILLYGSIAGMLILAVVILMILAWNAHAQGGLLSVLVWQPMLLLPLIASLGFLATGPFDNLWHSIFGRDKLTVWSPPHMLLLLNLALSCISVIGLALWLRSATPTGALAPSGDRRAQRWAARCIVIGLTLMMSYLWSFPSGWDVGVTDDSSVWMTMSWLCLPLVALVLAIGVACATPLLPARWWAPAAVIGLSTCIWWMLPDSLLHLVGYRPGSGLPFALPLGSIAYCLIRSTTWPRLTRSIAAALAIAAVLLLALAAGRLNYVSPLDIVLALPLGCLLIEIGDRIGTAMANLLLRCAGDQPSSPSTKEP